MKQKKRIAVAIGLLCLVVASACGKSQTGMTDTENQTPIEDVEQKQQSEDVSADMNKETEPFILQLPEYEFTRGNLPKMDGSTSLVPLGKALVSALLGETEQRAEDLVSFHKTTQSYRNLMEGTCELVLGSWPDESVFDEMKQAGFDCQMEEISTEALIFVVNADNPVDNLTTQQIKDIYTGKITNWSEVGGRDEKIDAFQRNVGSGSQALMEKLVMQGDKMADAPETYMIGSMGELMEAVKNYDNSATALGYSVYYYANDMKMAEGLKIISVDGVEPDSDTIRQKKYPHTNAYYCAIDGKTATDSPQRIIYDWLVGAEGQKLVASQGYVSIIDTGITGKEQALVTPNYTRMTEAFIPKLVADSSYGYIYPFVGEVLYASGEDGYMYVAGKKKGLIDENGRIIADPVYSDCLRLRYVDEYEHTLPFWKLEQTNDEDGAYSFGLASIDGSFVLECEYDSIYAGGDGIFVKKSYEDASFFLLDHTGKQILSDKELTISNPDYYVEMSDGEGILTVCESSGQYYFVNLKGEKLFDANYSYASAFVRGRAVVAMDDRYGIIDTQGNEIVPIEQDWVNVVDKHYLSAGNQEHFYLFDQAGTLVADTLGEPYLFTDEDGNYCLMTEEENRKTDGSTVSYYSPDGTQVYAISPNLEYQLGTRPVFYSQKGRDLMVENKKTGQKKTFPGYENFTPLMGGGWWEDMYIGDMDNLPYAVLCHYDETEAAANKSALVGTDLEILMEVPGDIYGLRDTENDTLYFLSYVEAEQKYHLYDENLKELCVSENYPSVCNDKIFIYNDYSATCVSTDGTILFSYAFVGALGD